MSERHIPTENLEIWHRAAAENRALRLLQIADMAKSDPIPQGAEPSEALPCPTLSLPEYGAQIPNAETFAKAMALDEQLAFCRARLSPDAPPPAVGELQAAPAAPRVARLAGSVFDAAFRRFLPLLGTARPIYLSSIGELMEELAAGNADFALLPIEDAKGVRFLSFYEEFDRLELHVTHVCPVFSEENGSDLRFALLSKQYRPNGKIRGVPLLEYRLSGQDGGALASLLTAAEAVGLTLRRVDSLPAPYFEDGYIFHVILAAENGNAALLHAYLTSALPRATLVGTYLDIKDGK